MKSSGSVRLVDALYDGLAVPLLRAALPLVASVMRPLRPRISAWYAEERITRRRLRELHRPPGGCCWVHAASVGELEQLLPIVRELRACRPDITPDITIVATVTSISAISHARQSPLLDEALLLPVDHLPTMRRLVAALQPTVLVIDRYDLWRSMIRAVREANVPVVLINATAPTRAGRGPIGAWMRNTYQQLTEILAVTNDHAGALHAIAPNVPIAVVADSRVDQVMYRMATTQPNAALAAWFDASASPAPVATVATLIVGSAWPEDVEMLAAALHGMPDPPRVIVVPHQLSDADIVRTCSQLGALRYSTDQPDPHRNLVVDAYGLLVDLYPRCTAAWVGGGFGVGVHSTTEPACAQLPIACGPHIARSEDARSLHTAGALTVITTVDDARSWLQSHVDTAATPHPAVAAWFESRKGASSVAARHVLHYLS